MSESGQPTISINYLPHKAINVAFRSSYHGHIGVTVSTIQSGVCNQRISLQPGDYLLLRSSFKIGEEFKIHFEV